MKDTQRWQACMVLSNFQAASHVSHIPYLHQQSSGLLFKQHNGGKPNMKYQVTWSSLSTRSQNNSSATLWAGSRGGDSNPPKKLLQAREIQASGCKEQQHLPSSTSGLHCSVEIKIISISEDMGYTNVYIVVALLSSRYKPSSTQSMLNPPWWSGRSLIPRSNFQWNFKGHYNQKNVAQAVFYLQRQCLHPSPQ